jgi:hypothetical protein
VVLGELAENETCVTFKQKIKDFCGMQQTRKVYSERKTKNI